MWWTTTNNKTKAQWRKISFDKIIEEGCQIQICKA